jgi:hypothetical protein
VIPPALLFLLSIALAICSLEKNKITQAVKLSGVIKSERKGEKVELVKYRRCFKMDKLF